MKALEGRKEGKGHVQYYAVLRICTAYVTNQQYKESF
jgi:hypothetical protein